MKKNLTFIAMSKKPVRAFFVGRAVAEGIYEQLEKLFANTLSEISKFDAEQRENFRQFSEEVLERAYREAEQEMENSQNNGVAEASTSIQPRDLQTIIDELRAEVAQARAELQRYRSNSV